MKVYILDFRLHVGQEINVGPGKFGEKNHWLFWSLKFVTKLIQIEINIFHISALINFYFDIKKLVRSLQNIMGICPTLDAAFKKNCQKKGKLETQKS